MDNVSHLDVEVLGRVVGMIHTIMRRPPTNGCALDRGQVQAELCSRIDALRAELKRRHHLEDHAIDAVLARALARAGKLLRAEKIAAPVEWGFGCA